MPIECLERIQLHNRHWKQAFRQKQIHHALLILISAERFRRFVRTIAQSRNGASVGVSVERGRDVKKVAVGELLVVSPILATGVQSAFVDAAIRARNSGYISALIRLRTIVMNFSIGGKLQIALYRLQLCDSLHQSGQKQWKKWWAELKGNDGSSCRTMKNLLLSQR